MTVRHTRIRRIEFNNYKAFPHFSINLSDTNILVGPNNAGKSTIIGAFRALDAALRFARTRKPSRFELNSGFAVGYRIPNDSMPISLENVQTNYNDEDSKITFQLSNGNKLSLVFQSDGGIFLIPIVEGRVLLNASVLKKEFPLNLIVVPVLGPVEHNEQRRERSTVLAGLSTHRASRHFRSYWHYFPENFDAFQDTISRTWPEIRIKPPEYDMRSGQLAMFCVEGLLEREIYWVGFGFQIWCQLVTHLSRADKFSLIVVDEPEVYLHPDIQRQLLGIIRDIGADVIIGTHSTEIISEADPSDIIYVDKRRGSGDRLKDISGVQKALVAVGSVHNITLTSLAKNRRVLFVEGMSDFRLIRRFARKMGFQELSAGAGITPLESGGFGSWQRISVLAAGIAEALGAPLMIGAIYDRDYFPEEQIQHVSEVLNNNLQFSHIFHFKEIENYLLNPTVIDRIVHREISLRGDKDGAITTKKFSCSEIIEEITQYMKNDTISQILARHEDYMKSRGIDKSQIYKSIFADFEARWASLNERLEIVSGKNVLADLRGRVQGMYGISLTDAKIIEAMTRAEIPHDMRQVIESLDVFRMRLN